MSHDAPVISNAGPLMVLAKLNLLNLLKQLYGRVYFARSVYDETVIEGMRQGYEDASGAAEGLQNVQRPRLTDQPANQFDVVDICLRLIVQFGQQWIVVVA